MMKPSKPLLGDDSSGVAFAQEMLNGDPTYAINFDRLQYHPQRGYIIFEFLLCDEAQTVSPLTSHPNRYWQKNSQKFLALFNAAKVLNATLYLVNYAKDGTKHAEEIRAIKVFEIDEAHGITKEESREFTRQQFSAWFRKLNRECQ